MEEKNIIVRGFNGFEVEYDKGIRIVDVKYKGESLNGVVDFSVVGRDQNGKMPSLLLRILADV